MLIRPTSVAAVICHEVSPGLSQLGASSGKWISLCSGTSRRLATRNFTRSLATGPPGGHVLTSSKWRGVLDIGIRRTRNHRQRRRRQAPPPSPNPAILGRLRRRPWGRSTPSGRGCMAPGTSSEARPVITRSRPAGRPCGTPRRSWRPPARCTRPGRAPTSRCRAPAAALVDLLGPDVARNRGVDAAPARAGPAARERDDEHDREHDDHAQDPAHHPLFAPERRRRVAMASAWPGGRISTWAV